MIRARWVLASLPLLMACSNAPSPLPATALPSPTTGLLPAYPAGESTHFLTVGAVSRRFLVYRPAPINPPSALVLVLHGGGGTGLGVANPGQHPLAVFRTVADAEGFLLVYPEGSLDNLAAPGWNDCRSDAPSGSSGDDLDFLHALIARLKSETSLPSSRTFLAGTSNGAVMAFAYAYHFGSTVKAIAVSSGNLPALPKSGPCTTGPAAPIPIMLTHGTQDPAMPVNGGCVVNFGGLCNRGTVVSQQQTLDSWLALNGLTGVTPTQSTIEVSVTDQGSAERIFYAGPAPLLYFKLNGAGHPVPSKTVLTSYAPTSGFQNRDIEFAQEAWTFFASLF
jgi:polyhydroxybutyrate depolymerase